MKNRVDGILAYFKSNGWRLDSEKDDGKTASYILDPPNPKTTWWLPVPRSDSYEHWDRTMAYTVHMLSKIEERSEAEVLDDLLNPFSDRLSFRIKSSAVASGTVSLSSFRKLLSASTDIIKAAVKDVDSPEHQHKRLSGKAVKKLMDSAQVGQTGQGSFVFTVYIPVVEADGSLNMYRDVLIHILNSFSSAVDEKWEKTASTNLYRSLLAMDLWEDTEVEISVKWSPLAKPSQHTRSATKIGKAVFGRIREAMDDLNNSVSENRVDDEMID